MVKVVLFEHPFKTERSITERPAGIIRSYLPPTSLDFFVVKNDQRATLDDTADDGDTIILRAIPAGWGAMSNDQLEGEVAKGENAPAKTFGGAVLLAIGLAVLVANPLTGIPLLVGAVFAGAGVVSLGWGATSWFNAAVSQAFLDQRSKSIDGKGQTRPDIRGARNQANPNGKLPLILGKHKLFPYYACTPYTSFETPTGGDASNNAGQDLYLNILFALGYAPLKISNVKIGEIAISTPEQTADGAIDVSDCPYAGITGYFDNGAIPSAFAYVVKEEQVNITLEGTEYGTSVGAVTPPTAFSALSVVVDASEFTVTAPVGTNLDTDYAFKPGQMVQFSGFTNAGNNGSFIVVNVRQVSSTGTNRQLVLASESTSLVDETKTGVDYILTPLNMVTTPKDVTEITVHLTFPQGFAGFTSSGIVDGAALVVKAYYRLKGTLAWSEFPYFVGSSWTLSGFQAKSTIRLAATKTGLTAGEYEVRLARETGATDNKDGVNYYDTTVWTTLQCKTGISVCTDPTNVSFLYLKIKATSAISGTLDQISLVAEATYTEAVTGANWTEDADYRYSPASALLWVLTGPANPRALTGADRATFIDYTRIAAWRDYCAATVSGAQFHTCNAVVTESFSMQQLLSLIASTGRGFFHMSDGLYSIGWDAATSTIVQCLTPRNSWDFQWTKQFNELPALLKVGFVNAADDWTADEAQVYLDGGSAASTPKESIASWGTTASDEIYREGRYNLKSRALRPEAYTTMMDAEQLACTIGDRIEVAHDALLVGGSWGRVKTVSLDGSSQPISVTVDEPCNMETAVIYAVRIRNQAGAVYSIVDTVVGENYTLTFDSPLTAGSIAEGDVFQFGVQNLESLSVTVVGVEMLEDLSARLSLIPYNEDVFDEDSIAPPTFASKISKKPVFSPALVGLEVDRASQVVVGNTQKALVGGRYWGKYEDTAPAIPAVGDLYTRYSETSGDANRGVFRWNGASWDRTEERQYIMRATTDIAFLIAYKDATGTAIYGAAADYTDDAVTQADFAFFQNAVVGFLQAETIEFTNRLSSVKSNGYSVGDNRVLLGTDDNSIFALLYQTLIGKAGTTKYWADTLRVSGGLSDSALSFIGDASFDGRLRSGHGYDWGYAKNGLFYMTTGMGLQQPFPIAYGGGVLLAFKNIASTTLTVYATENIFAIPSYTAYGTHTMDVSGQVYTAAFFNGDFYIGRSDGVWKYVYATDTISAALTFPVAMVPSRMQVVGDYLVVTTTNSTYGTYKTADGATWDALDIVLRTTCPFYGNVLLGQWGYLYDGSGAGSAGGVYSYDLDTDSDALFAAIAGSPITRTDTSTPTVVSVFTFSYVNNVLFAVVYDSSSDSYLCKSSDLGATWTEVDLSSFSFADFWIEIDVARSCIVLRGDNGRCLVSNDYAVSWQEITATACTDVGARAQPAITAEIDGTPITVIPVADGDFYTFAHTENSIAGAGIIEHGYGTDCEYARYSNGKLEVWGYNGTLAFSSQTAKGLAITFPTMPYPFIVAPVVFSTSDSSIPSVVYVRHISADTVTTSGFTYTVLLDGSATGTLFNICYHAIGRWK